MVAVVPPQKGQVRIVERRAVAQGQGRAHELACRLIEEIPESFRQGVNIPAVHLPVVVEGTDVVHRM